MNPFTVLGLETTATAEQAKAAWRKLCMLHHPDRGGSDAKMVELNEAYKQVLVLIARGPSPTINVFEELRKGNRAGFRVNTPFGFGASPRFEEMFMEAVMRSEAMREAQAKARAQGQKKPVCPACKGTHQVQVVMGICTVKIRCPECSKT